MYEQQINKLAGIIEAALELAAKGVESQTPIVALDMAEKASRIMKNLEQAEQIHVENAANRALIATSGPGNVRLYKWRNECHSN